MGRHGNRSRGGSRGLRQGQVTHAILGLLLHWHLAIVPVFLPKISGIHNAQMAVTAAPRWHHILHTGELEQPDGAMIYEKFRF